MHRNLDRRVETLVRVTDPTVRAQLDGLLDEALAPDVVHWRLGPDGGWERRPAAGEPARDLHRVLVRRTAERASGG
jgi:polyphosphate kinase